MQTARKRARAYARLRNVQLDEFSKHLKYDVERAVNGKSPFKVAYGKGKYFVVFSADEWKSEQETLHVLQNTDMVRQIAEASKGRLAYARMRRSKSARVTNKDNTKGSGRKSAND